MENLPFTLEDWIIFKIYFNIFLYILFLLSFSFLLQQHVQYFKGELAAGESPFHIRRLDNVLNIFQYIYIYIYIFCFHFRFSSNNKYSTSKVS